MVRQVQKLLFLPLYSIGDFIKRIQRFRSYILNISSSNSNSNSKRDSNRNRSSNSNSDSNIKGLLANTDLTIV